MNKRFIRGIIKGFLFPALVLTFSALPVSAEEEIGLIPKLWRKLFKRQPAAEKEMPRPDVSEPEDSGEDGKENNFQVKYDADGDIVSDEEIEGLTPEEYEQMRNLSSDLKRQKEERELLETIRRAQDAQRMPQQPPRPPR
ncbi:MAG: hypothetical protein ABH825_02550 [Candidatus Omnitrophota bacterium]